jgi:hypothetical protein
LTIFANLTSEDNLPFNIKVTEPYRFSLNLAFIEASYRLLWAPANYSMIDRCQSITRKPLILNHSTSVLLRSCISPKLHCYCSHHLPMSLQTPLRTSTARSTEAGQASTPSSSMLFRSTCIHRVNLRNSIDPNT